MSIIGIESLIYGVGDVAQSTRFFQDFGLTCVEQASDYSIFLLQEGSRVIIRHRDDPKLPLTDMVGDGVREVIWGVDSQKAVNTLAAGLSTDRNVDADADGSVHFMTDVGVAMGLRHFHRNNVVYAPDPVNAPGRVNRLNQHRKWRQRAYPKVISHVVFAVTDYEAGYAFMRDRMGFRLSDFQRGFGMYLRCDGTNAHHNLLLLNANAPLPDMDGKLRFHHANFGVEDIDEIMVGANHMTRKGWEPSHFGLGRHRIDSALFYYLPCPAGGEAEYGTDSDCVDDSWVPRDWVDPFFAYAHFVHNLPPFLMNPPAWKFEYLTSQDTFSSEDQH